MNLAYSWSLTPCAGICLDCGTYSDCGEYKNPVCDGSESVVCVGVAAETTDSPGMTPITEEDVYDLQATWAQAIKDISAAYLAGEDFMQVANDAAAALYGYGYTDVLFKPTKASEYPFRPTATGALSYFVGGSNVVGGYSEDKGFAHNVGKGWSDVRFENVQIDLVDK